MYCPHCGVNNDRKEAACFICHKPLPTAQAFMPVDAAAAGPRAREKREATIQIASVGDRMIALFFDRIVVFSLVVIAGAFAADRWKGYTFVSALWGLAGVAGGWFLATFLYHFISEAAFLTTIGKAAMGLNIAMEEGRGRVGGAAVRNALRLIDGLGVYLIGFLFATFSSRRQRIGDLVGGTVVLEWPIARGGRAAVMVLMIAIAAAAVWIAGAVCPACRDALLSFARPHLT